MARLVSEKIATKSGFVHIGLSDLHSTIDIYDSRHVL